MKPRAQPLKSCLLATSLLGLTAAVAHSAPALPIGGKVVAGSATIGAPAGGALAVTQSSQKAIIDWGSFSIGKGGAVAFLNGRGATLNRVTGRQVSSLDGLLTATGSVYLINPNGVIIGRSGVVDVGGTFVASTLDTSDAGFLSGGPLSFSGSSGAAVLNYGRVGALGGDVALVAARVVNDGSVTAANGDAGLLAGYRVVLQDTSLDSGRFAVELGGAGTRVTNRGLIAAADAELRAEGGNVYALAGDTAGVIRATGVKNGGGKVWLVAEDGQLNVAGAIQAQGVGDVAGLIETSGHVVKLGSARIDANGGTWLIDPYDLTIDATAAGSIDSALSAGTSVTEQTTADGYSGAGVANSSGKGDITVAAPLSWSTPATLTLSAYRNIDVDAAISLGGGSLILTAGTGETGSVGPGQGAIAVNAPIEVSGAGKVNLTATYDTATVPETSLLELAFANGGSIDYGATNQGGQLNVDKHVYTLIYGLSDLANISGTKLTYDALATSVVAPSSAYSAAVVSTFAGTFEGLGHTVSGLTVSTSGSAAGLFGYLRGGVIRDLALAGGTVSNSASSGYAGELVGFSVQGVIANVSASGVVSSGFAGGLVGVNDGVLVDASAAVTVNGQGFNVLGGVAGENGGTILNSSATGSINGGPLTVNANEFGGLVGQNDGAGVIINSFSTGDVSDPYAVAPGAAINGALMGGLVGENGGAITASHATGSVSAAGPYGLGGLAGENDAGTISTSYATGAVSAGSDSSGVSSVGGLVGFTENAGGDSAKSLVTQSYATGPVSGIGRYTYVGGLIGENVGDITYSDATGSVSSTGTGPAGKPAYGAVGGLVGYNLGGSISEAFAIGDVITKGTVPSVGGLVGSFVNATLTGGYYDTQTSGRDSDGAGATGLTTEQLQAALPSGFSSSEWGQIMGVSYPYQLALFSVPPQVISGHAYRTASATGTFSNEPVIAIIGGSTVVGRVVTGADNAYYIIAPAGTLPAGSTVVEYLDGAPVKATTAVEQVAAGASLTGLNLNGGVAALYTPDTTLSATGADLARGLGTATAAGGGEVLFSVSGGTIGVASGAALDLFAQGSGFDLDQSLNLGSGNLLLQAAGAVTQSGGVLTADKVQGTSVGGVALDQPGNMVAALNGWTDPSGAVSLTDGEALTVGGPVNGGASVQLTVGSGGLVLSRSVVGGPGGVTLQAAGTVGEVGSGLVRTLTGPLGVTAQGGLDLEGANIGHSVTLQNTGGGSLHYTALGNLTLGTVSNGTSGPLILASTLNPGGVGSITLDGQVLGGQVTLASAAGVKAGSAGAIDASLLTGSAAGAVALGGANLVGGIKGFTAAGGFSLTDGETLTVSSGSTLGAPGQAVSLTTTAGDIVVNGTLDAATVNLTSQAGALKEGSAGAIVATTLNATADMGINLVSSDNQITTIGTDTTTSGPNRITQ